MVRNRSPAPAPAARALTCTKGSGTMVPARNRSNNPSSLVSEHTHTDPSCSSEARCAKHASGGLRVDALLVKQCPNDESADKRATCVRTCVPLYLLCVRAHACVCVFYSTHTHALVIFPRACSAALILRLQTGPATTPGPDALNHKPTGTCVETPCLSTRSR